MASEMGIASGSRSKSLHDNNPSATISLDRPDDLLAFEVEGRLLWLPRNHYRRSADYVASISRGPANIVGDDSVDGGVRKIEVRDLLDLLFPLPAAQPDSVVGEPPPCVQPTKDSTYYLDMAVFQVEDSLFKVPKHHFLQSSLAGSLAGTADNNDDARPMKLEGVLKTDFCALLKLLYPLYLNTTLSEDEWESVLRLATRYKMLKLRRLAIEKLSSLPPIKRVVLGREMKVASWLRSGYTDLAQRKESLSAEEFRSLGLQTALRLSQKVRRRGGKSGAPSILHPPSEDASFTEVINDVFKTELHEETASLSIIDRILLARDYCVSEWLRAGFVDLAQRREDITIEEAKKLGLETTARLCHVRERIETSSSFSVFGTLCLSNIDKLFGKELEDVQAAGLSYDDNPLEITAHEEPPTQGLFSVPGPPQEPKVSNNTRDSLVISAQGSGSEPNHSTGKMPATGRFWDSGANNAWGSGSGTGVEWEVRGKKKKSKGVAENTRHSGRF